MTANPLSPSEVRQNLIEIRQRLSEAAKESGNKPDDVRLMAVTKTVPPELVNVAWEEGVRLFGENRAQELIEKANRYAFGPGHIHFIGTLQTNKVRQIIDKVSCIQSVNSLHLAQEIEKRASALGKIMDILLEVNIGGEASKTGADYREVLGLLEKISILPSLRVRGLMCIPPFGREESETEQYFDRMYKIFVDIKAQKIDNISMEILSMGMTGDYPLAVRHGANLVRIGTGIFGKRN